MNGKGIEKKRWGFKFGPTYSINWQIFQWHYPITQPFTHQNPSLHSTSQKCEWIKSFEQTLTVPVISAHSGALCHKLNIFSKNSLGMHGLWCVIIKTHQWLTVCHSTHLFSAFPPFSLSLHHRHAVLSTFVLRQAWLVWCAPQNKQGNLQRHRL